MDLIEIVPPDFDVDIALAYATPDNFTGAPVYATPYCYLLTLIDETGKPLDRGTGFDAFTPLSHHGAKDISADARRNRLLLLGLMTEAGWDFYRNEWWHYQLFNSRDYTLVSDAELPRPMMPE